MKTRTRTSARSWAVAAAVFVRLGSCPPEAEASPPESEDQRRWIAVLPVEAHGPGQSEVPAASLADLREAITETFHDRGGLEVLEFSSVDALLDEPCEDLDCRRDLTEQLAVDFVVVSELELEDGDFSVSISVVSLRSDDDLGPFLRDCPICSRAELDHTVRSAATDALVQILRVGPMVDPAPAPTSRGPSPLTMAGLSLAGAGLATTVGGVVLLSIHHQPAGCIRDPRFGECLGIRYSTLAPGGSLLGAGLTVAAAGVAMLIAGLRARRGKPKRASVGHRLGPELRF